MNAITRIVPAPLASDLIERCIADLDFYGDITALKMPADLAETTLQRAFENWCFDNRLDQSTYVIQAIGYDARGRILNHLSRLALEEQDRLLLAEALDSDDPEYVAEVAARHADWLNDQRNGN